MKLLKNLFCLCFLVILIGLSSQFQWRYNLGSQIPGSQRDNLDFHSFQVGVAAEDHGGYREGFGIPVTGGRLEMKISGKDSDSIVQLSYWIGIDLQNGALIRVGYLVNASINGAQPSWFWAYSTRAFEIARIGLEVGSDGDWVGFSLILAGTTWGAYVGDAEVGHISFNETYLGGGPFSVAEISFARTTIMNFGSVEFRNLAYRDRDLHWQFAPSAVACCYLADNTRLNENALFGVTGIPGEDNHWLVGGRGGAVDGQRLWPWYYVNVESELGAASGSGWYVKGDIVSPEGDESIYQREATRRILTGWLLSGQLIGETLYLGTSLSFVVSSNLTLKAHYTTQFYLDVTSQLGGASGSGWYDQGYSQPYYTETPSPQPSAFQQCQWFFKGWYEGSRLLSSNTSGTLVMDSPHSVVGEWQLECRDCLFSDICTSLAEFWYSLMGVAAIVFFTIMLVFAFRIAGKFEMKERLKG
ncbi:MAG TPA: hypothetical protein VEG61_03970 [Candidatus Dormibacteraeota bacterium]|nr:hypothetical protein [Candidatus Dormibacteraeota bacterium]